MTELKPSTYTSLFRNEGAVKFTSEIEGVSPINTILDQGSSVIEPFIILSMPGFENTTLVAVDSSDKVVALMDKIKRGKKIPWSTIAEVCSNEGRPNQDLLLPERIQASLKRLKDIGALENLGPNFDADGMQIPDHISKRVTVVQSDVLEFLNKHPEQRYDMISSFFLLLNIIRSNNNGDNILTEIIKKSLNMLSDQGVFLVGDVSESLPTIFSQFANLSTVGSLNIASLSHLANWGNRVVTTHYLMASQMENVQSRHLLANSAKHNLTKIPEVQVYGSNYNVSSLADESTKYLFLSYVGESPTNGQGFFSVAKKNEAFNQIVPNKGDQKSTKIIFPAQKETF